MMGGWNDRGKKKGWKRRGGAQGNLLGSGGSCAYACIREVIKGGGPREEESLEEGERRDKGGLSAARLSGQSGLSGKEQEELH